MTPSSPAQSSRMTKSRIGTSRGGVTLPVATTATWTITRARAKLEFNQPATEGRARELVYGLGLRWPRLNGWSDLEYTTSGEAIGSDFEYRRAGGSLGLEVPL